MTVTDNQFLTLTNVDRRKVARVKKTVLIVNPWRPRRGPEPELYPLTDGEVSALYRRSFTGVGELTYDAFVRLVGPAIGQYDHHLTGRFDMPIYRVPTAGDK